jgi:undecaprenyl-diphosphatase
MRNGITRLVRGMRDLNIGTAPVMLLLLCAAGIYGFLAIADEVSENEIESFDTFVFMLFRNPADIADPLGPPWFEETMAEITALGGYPVLVVLVAAVVGYLLVVRHFGPALFVLVSIVSGTAVSQLLKTLYDRPRPDLVEHLVTTHTASFPSGHATMGALVYLTLASLIVRLVDDRPVRAYVVSFAVALALAIGISRVYLGVHWPSDVIAGWALGIAWASLSWLTISALRAYRMSRRTP